MAEDQGTLNTADSSPAEGVPAQSGDLVSTVDMQIETPSEETQKTETTDGGDQKPGEKETEAKPEQKDEGQKAEKPEEDRFDKHPRFQKLIQDRRELQDKITQLEQQLGNVQQQPKQEPKIEAPDLSELTADLWEDDPDKARKILSDREAYLAQQVREEVKTEMEQRFQSQQEAQERKSIEDEYNRYAKEHPDFDDMWDSGDLQAYMEEHPGSTAKEAHMALTREKEIQAAVDEAIQKKEAELTDKEKEAAENQKAKKNAQVLGSGPSAGGRVAGQTPAELKDTKKYGGLAAVLAQRSLARESQQQTS